MEAPPTTEVALGIAHVDFELDDPRRTLLSIPVFSMHNQWWVTQSAVDTVLFCRTGEPSSAIPKTLGKLGLKDTTWNVKRVAENGEASMLEVFNSHAAYLVSLGTLPDMLGRIRSLTLIPVMSAIVVCQSYIKSNINGEGRATRLVDQLRSFTNGLPVPMVTSIAAYHSYGVDHEGAVVSDEADDEEGEEGEESHGSEDTAGTPDTVDESRLQAVDQEQPATKRARSARVPSEEAGPDSDVYGCVAKMAHRYEFAINCKHVADRSPYKEILYLETAAGKTTQELLNRGFAQSDLHPCNFSLTELNGLLAKYPGVVVEHGNILDIFKEQRWLGVWFDLETSLLRIELPGQPWDDSRVPEFRHATVCAISLSHRRVEGTTEQFAIELQVLMQEGHGFLTSPQMARAYSGRSNKQTMVFGLSHYDVLRWEPADYLYQHVHVPLDYYGTFAHVENYMIINNNLVAVVSRLSATGMLHLTFQSREGWFFRDEDPEPPLPPATVDRWLTKRLRARPRST